MASNTIPFPVRAVETAETYKRGSVLTLWKKRAPRTTVGLKVYHFPAVAPQVAAARKPLPNRPYLVNGASAVAHSVRPRKDERLVQASRISRQIEREVAEQASRRARLAAVPQTTVSVSHASQPRHAGARLTPRRLLRSLLSRTHTA